MPLHQVSSGDSIFVKLLEELEVVVPCTMRNFNVIIAPYFCDSRMPSIAARRYSSAIRRTRRNDGRNANGSLRLAGNLR